MGTDELERKISQFYIDENLDGQLPQETLEQVLPNTSHILYQETVEIYQGYIPSLVREKIRQGKIKEAEEMLMRVMHRKIFLMADNGNQTPEDIYDEVSGRD